MIEPWWPLAVVAAIQLVDAALSWRPVRFVADCLRDVGYPERWWWLLSPIKIAAAAGLVIGIWVEPLALLTSACLVGYFVIAIAMHIRARDFGRNLFVNATGMLIICVALLIFVAYAR
jgi:hypothetical protein